MGICMSAALRVTVFDNDGNKKVSSFSMKKMRTFQTMEDVFVASEIAIGHQDRIYARTHVGLEEIPIHAQFQIRDLIVKNAHYSIKYRIVMESLY